MTPWELKVFRESNKLTQQEFGLKLGMPLSAAGRNVRGYELGERKIPATVQRLLEYVKKYGFLDV